MRDLLTIRVDLEVWADENANHAVLGAHAEHAARVAMHLLPDVEIDHTTTSITVSDLFTT